ncbi:extracellular ligand-binding receptor [Pseudomonas sp. StFLB209]|uniref:ABC transporter substrate-binding protein n=1 Tax=Pseudomonas sp. StFLB209 TaxID=1028989 RepID=UPI0004F747B9|nr:ABC transporter substrate-binding protein [Pseudomonas sp. StFLB209]BAP44871.1 extracellular ligand-binding receptor [Pseudomonas sp. StFLB209]
MTPTAMKVGISAVFDPAVTPHARTFLRALAAGRNLIPGLAGVQWHWLDDGADPRQAAMVAQQMVEWGADLVLGHFSSDAALAAAPLYACHQIALLTPAATLQDLTRFPNVLRGCPSDRQLAGELLAWAISRLWQRLYVQADDSAHGQALAAAIRHSALAHGLQPVTDREQADAEVFAGRLKSSCAYLQARRRAGCSRPLIFTDDAVSPFFGTGQPVGDQPQATWVIGFHPGPEDCPAARQHRQWFASPAQTYYRESLRLLHGIGVLARRNLPDRRALLDALCNEVLATPLGPLAFLQNEIRDASTQLWHLGPQGLQPVTPTF